MAVSNYHKWKAKNVKPRNYDNLTDEIIKAREDFGFFCAHVTRNSSRPCIPAGHHEEWHKEFVTGKNSKELIKIAGVNVDILAPRGAAKSTVIGLFAAWAIGIHALEKIALQILYISYNLSAARGKSATIKRIITSQEYTEIFPLVIPGEKWADEHWSIDFDAAGIVPTGSEMFTMICAGSAGTITSKRSNLIFYDDPIKSMEQIASLAVREKMASNYSVVIKPTLLEGGRVISVGTRFRPDDIHCTTFIPEKGWKQIEQSAVIEVENGELISYWPEMWSIEYLEGLYRDDPIPFMWQYQNKVQDLESLGIERDWIIFEDPPTQFDALVVGIDLAASLKSQADYTVMMLLGVSDGLFYFLDYRMDKWRGNLEKCDALLELYEEWHEPGITFNVYVEAVAYQSSFKGDFQSYIINQLEIEEIVCTGWILKGDKLSHLLSVSGQYANGLIRYNKYVFDKTCEPIIQMTNFGILSHDDCMDATVIALQGSGIRRRLDAA